MRREWVQICSGYHHEEGWIPRDVLERMKIDCSPLDQTPQGTVWFNVRQAKAIHKHREFESSKTNSTERGSE